MAMIFLYLNASLWIGLGLWCTVASEKTSTSMGLTLASPAGRCEFITVYGGLELGLGAFFLYGAVVPAWSAAAVLAALFAYAGLGLLRLGAILFVKDAGRAPLLMLGVEALMAAWAAWLHLGT